VTESTGLKKKQNWIVLLRKVLASYKKLPTCKVAEELNVKPSLINKAIKVAMKRDWTRHTDEFEDLETIVATLGYDKDD